MTRNKGEPGEFGRERERWKEKEGIERMEGGRRERRCVPEHQSTCATTVMHLFHNLVSQHLQSVTHDRTGVLIRIDTQQHGPNPCLNRNTNTSNGVQVNPYKNI